MDIITVSGWLGAILVLVAYLLNSINLLKADSYLYQSINILGAAFLIYYTFKCNAVASMVVNVIWVTIGLTTLSKFIIKKHKLKLIRFINKL